MNPFFIVFLTISFFLIQPHALAQSGRTVEFMKSQQLMIEDDINTIRSEIRPVLTPAEKKIETSVEVTVDLIDNPLLAFSTTRSGQREIHIPVGFARMLQMIAHSIVIQKAFNKPGIAEEWLRYGLNGIAENQKALRTGKPTKFIKSIYDYANLTSTQIKSLSADRPLRDLYGQLYIGMLAFVYGHELGHLRNLSITLRHFFC